MNKKTQTTTNTNIVKLQSNNKSTIILWPRRNFAILSKQTGEKLLKIYNNKFIEGISWKSQEESREKGRVNP